MTLKKAFPFLSLILFSALAVPFAFLVLWNMDVDSNTLAEQFNSTLNLAVPSSIALIVLIWFGAGLEYAISFIPAAFGFVFIYLGAGFSFTSRWLAGRIWRENQGLES